MRGLNYQVQQPQGKLVRTIADEIFDVVVDLRKGSAGFGRWSGVRLSAESRAQLWIPPGFAHGFNVLSPWAEVVYRTTDLYAPRWERTIIWNDPQIGIGWPLLDGQPPILSPKDASGRLLRGAEVYERKP